jgi:uncharacterized protein with PIN domain
MRKDNNSSNVEQLFKSLKEIRSICPICNIKRREIKLSDLTINQRNEIKEKIGILEFKRNMVFVYCRSCKVHSVLI